MKGLPKVERGVGSPRSPRGGAGVNLLFVRQRLVRLNCPKCRQPYQPTPYELEALRLTPEEKATARFGKGAGCAECRGTGYKGRIGVFELILGTPEFRDAIAKGYSYPDMVNVATKQGFKPMIADGKAKVLAGWTTPDEVIRAVFTQTVDSDEEEVPVAVEV